MIRVCMKHKHRCFGGLFCATPAGSRYDCGVEFEAHAEKDIAHPPRRCAFDPKHPVILIVTVCCALVCLLDAALIVVMSVATGPWDVLEDPTRALELTQQLDAAVLRDDVASGFHTASPDELAAAGEDAAMQWDLLRDEAVELEIIDDPASIDEIRDESVSLFDPSVKPPLLPFAWRVILGSLASSVWVLPGVALLWLLWRRMEVFRACKAGLSLPLANGAGGISAAVIVMGGLSAWTLLLGIVVSFANLLPPLDEMVALLSASALLLWIVPTVLLMWLCTVFPNGGVWSALGLTAVSARAGTLQCVGAVLFALGVQEVVLLALSVALPDFFAAGAWWEGFDELIAFGPVSLAVLDTLDAVVGAPIVEEIIFRGLLFGALVRGMGFTAAAIVSSLVFAAVHGYGLAGTVAVTATGSLLCWVYWSTGRLWAAMLAHGVHNAMVLLPLWAARTMANGWS